MNALLNALRSSGSSGPRTLAGTAVDLVRRGIALSLIWLIVPLGVSGLAYGQDAPPPPPPDQAAPDQGPPPPDQGYDQGPPPQQWQALSPTQLDQLVAPIALYPDSLVAQVLAAATYPAQVADADRFVQSHPGLPPDAMASMANSQNWDPSVKALTAFPSVLADLDRNLDWATQLGNAYYNQPQDVMSAVQADRQEAWQSGKLRPTPQLDVSYSPSAIVIQPVNPAVVYVPYYNPWAVWGWQPYYRWYAPPPPPGIVLGVGLAFGVGIAVGAWGHWGWGWGHWGMGWGPHPAVFYNRGFYVSRSMTVFNHGYYGHFDRGPEARAWNMRAAAQARAAGYNHGYQAGAHAGYNAGAHAGYNQGYNRGATQGFRGNGNFNRGTANGFHAPQQNNNRAQPAYNRPQQNYNRPAQNYNRPAQNYNRPAQNYNRPAQNYNRPQQNYNRPQQNYNRPAQNYNRPAQNDGRPAGNARPAENHPQGAGRAEHGGGGHEPHGH